jgi:hypothetical protein
MKKNLKKLHLHRDTLVLLDPKAVSIPFCGAAEAVVTSCTYPCGCPTGCSDEQACQETGLAD